jgi:DNA polymerase-3 subunit gamma/tau
MSYQVLARKWRPKNFAQIVGQKHVVQALVNALNQQRLHHAYLLTGTRGVGKTTIARILSKCLNCETGITAIPCGQCPTCLEVDAGCFVDLLEIDAASRTKVEETRELLNNVPYAPIKGRYKVYLIDEVHMLSTHSFNALLKTLEEPPSHVLFILATTDPERIPATIRSRCLQFHLKAMPIEQIATQLEHILKQEKISFEIAALTHLAQAANGSMRDALSLLDQAISFCNQDISIQTVHEMLGTVLQQPIVELLSALAAQDANSLLAISATLAEQGADFAQALQALLSLIHQIALAQYIPSSVYVSGEPTAEIQKLISLLKPEDLQLYYQIGLLGQRDLAWAPTPRIGLEMTLLRMLAFRPLQGPPQATSKPPIIDNAPISAPQAIAAAPTQRGPTEIEIQPASVLPTLDWILVYPQLKLSGLAQILASYCALQQQENDLLYLLLDSSQAALCNPTQQQRITEALSEYFGRPIKINLAVAKGPVDCPARISKQQHSAQLAQATDLIAQDPKINALLNQFNGKIEPNSLKLLKEVN